MRNFTLAPCLLLACSLPMLANAQVQRAGDYLSKMDVDGDGRVSLVEYQDWLGYAFHGMDRDRNGVLSAAEQPGGRGTAGAAADLVADTGRVEHRKSQVVAAVGGAAMVIESAMVCESCTLGEGRARHTEQQGR